MDLCLCFDHLENRTLFDVHPSNLSVRNIYILKGHCIILDENEKFNNASYAVGLFDITFQSELQ